MEHHHELLVRVLKPIQGRWMELGTHLDLSVNFLDETETNFEEEDCLEEILMNWLKYQEPSMEALGKALTKMNLSTLTFDPSRKGQSHTATHRYSFTHSLTHSQPFVQVHTHTPTFIHSHTHKQALKTKKGSFLWFSFQSQPKLPLQSLCSYLKAVMCRWRVPHQLQRETEESVNL